MLVLHDREIMIVKKATKPVWSDAIGNLAEFNFPLKKSSLWCFLPHFTVKIRVGVVADSKF